MRKKTEWTLNVLVYGLWLLLVLGTAVYADFYNAALFRQTGMIWMLLAGILAFAPMILKRVRDWKPKSRYFGDNLSSWAFRAICFGCAMTILGFCFLAVNPGGFDGDPGIQLHQALNGEFNDYYPVLHTLLILWMPLTLTGGWFSSIILFQIFFFSLTLTYLCETVRAYSNTLWAFISLFVILMNPITQSYLMYGYKDETFGICAMMLVCMNARILFSEGEWLKKKKNFMLFSLMLAVTSLIRHNGILFAVPCLIGAILCVNRKRGLAVICIALLIFAGIRGPLYSAIGVTKAEDRSSQTMGLPMAIIGGAVKYRPERLDQELLAFAYSVAPKEVWDEKYTWGVYNWVDWDSRSNHQALAEAGIGTVLQYMVRAFREAPKECLKALIETTAITYGITTDHLADGAVYLSGGDLGIEDLSIPWMRDIMYGYRNLMYFVAPHCYLHSGLTLFLIMTVMLAKHPLKRKNSWRRIVPVMSVFCYNLVTTLMLFSWWDGARFFHYSLWVAPVLLVMLTYQDNTDKSCKEFS